MLIVIGFGFKDKHIQNAILEAVNQNPSFQLLIINYHGGENGTIDREGLKDFFEDDKCQTIKVKSNYRNYYEEHVGRIENNLCNFDINLLALQIKEECVY